jgi:hypothetical protein
MDTDDLPLRIDPFSSLRPNVSGRGRKILVSTASSGLPDYYSVLYPNFDNQITMEEQSNVALERITRMLDCCGTEEPFFPPTDLYNECWMLRLVLAWFSENPDADHPLAISGNERWYSEALLPSAFLPRYRGDPHAESWTHADGVIGNFGIGKNGAGDLDLKKDAETLVVLEAKMFSKLSPGVTHARYYNQAARNVACMAEVLRRANRQPSKIKRLAFFVIAPEQQVNAGIFEKQMQPESVLKTVKRRVNEYDESKEEWFNGWFIPTMHHIRIGVIPWEMLLGDISGVDAKTGSEFQQFYDLCLRFNCRPQPP